MPSPEQFTIQPSLWFAVLCNSTQVDEKGRISIGSIFNRWTMREVPGAPGPFVDAEAALVVGYSYGLGAYSATLELQDVDGHVLWRATEAWTFSLGPGSAAAATHAWHVQYYFTEPGHYYYLVKLQPGDREDRVHFEVVDPQPSSQEGPSQ